MHASPLAPLALGLLLAAQTPALAASDGGPPPAEPAPPAAQGQNPFAAKSPLPYQLPPFDRITDDDFRPAFEAGMAAQRKEVDAIAHDAAAPTFENTIVALERSGRMLDRVNRVFSYLIGANTDPKLDALNAEMAPKLSAHQDGIFMDPALWARVKALYEERAKLDLDPESARLLERYHTLFVRAGADLSPADREKLKTLNARISELTTKFQQNVLAATNAAAVVVDDVHRLDGLSLQQVAAAAEAAKERGMPGKWVITLQNTTDQPVLANLKDRALRKRIYEASISRGDGGPGDNREVIAELVKLRAEKARLQGYPDYAAYVLADETAQTPQAVDAMLAELAPAAVANARREAAALQKRIAAQARADHGKPFELEPWDWDFYAEQVRKAKYDYDESQVRPYFELEHVLKDGVFYAAHELYGLTLKERHDLPTYRKDVRVFEVFDADGSPLGLYLADFFSRSNKEGGAWMSSLVDQSRLLGTRAVVTNNLNIPKPPDGQPVLMTFDEVTTLFHEFGHALHGLLSNVEYPLFSGTNVPLDFVEYPSQFNEMWATDPTVLAHYARHYETGAPMPKALLDKVLEAGKFNEGYATTEYLAAAMYDQSWYQIGPKQAPDAKHVMAFERAALKKDGVDFYAVPPRYHSPYFLHIFSSGYAAGYYAYVWSEVLAADSAHWMRTHGGLDRANGDFLRAKVLSRGFSGDPMTLFRRFYGGEPEIGPLLEKRGLTLPKKRR